MAEKSSEIVPPTSLDQSVEFELPRKARLFLYACIISVATGQMLARVQTAQPHLSANDRSRWCTVWALVERGTYQIDEITHQKGWGTIDKVRHNDHFYSSKPPLLPFVVAGVYKVVKKTTGMSLTTHTTDTVRLILTIVQVIPMCLALCVLACLVERYSRSDITRFAILISAASATFLTTFVITFNNHTPAAISTLFAVYSAMRIMIDREQGFFHFANAGFFAAYACTCELPAALFGLVLFLMLVKTAPRQTWCYFVPAALVPIGGFFLTNYWATGGWKPFYMYYGTEKYMYEYKGRPSYWLKPNGIDKGGDTPAVYLFNCVIGHHGILSLSPIFCFSLVGWLGLTPLSKKLNAAAKNIRPILFTGCFLTLAIIGFYLTRTANYNYGGHTSGLRWTFWLTPFWLVAMIPAFDTFGHKKTVQLFMVVALLVSVFSVTYASTNPWQHPWLFKILEDAGVINYS